MANLKDSTSEPLGKANPGKRKVGIARRSPAATAPEVLTTQISANPAYRKVVAELHDCEERYRKLDQSSKRGTDNEGAADAALLKDEMEVRRGLDVELLAAIEDERRRIGQDLHDDLCQHLGAVALVAGSLAKEISVSNPAQRDKAATVPKLIGEAIKSCRAIAKGLHPVTLQAEGLPAALHELAARVPGKIEFRWPRTRRINFDPGVALHLYRIAEEAIGNAVKHSQAKRIAIELAVVKDRAVLAITNDGKGFDPRSKNGGMGIRNMRYRAKAIGATLTIEPGKGGGTCVRCTLPMNRNSDGGA
jgi:signal transduction histidine kinase